jgi:hypothetical protein
MKKVKLLFTAFAAIAIAGGVLAAKHKNSATYFSCDSNHKCTISHNISGINELVEREDPPHPNELDDATITFNADCSSSNCGTLFYGDGQ